MDSEAYDLYPERPRNCPPREAIPVIGLVIRGLRSKQVCPAEFRCAHEQRRDYDPQQECEACGLSVWRSAEEYRHSRKISSYVRRWGVATAQLKQHHGLVLATPRGQRPHHTYWPDVRYDLCKIFRAVDGTKL